MKKIMFNDNYGLTAAVLNGKKTMTRRIIPIDICNATDWKAFNEGDMKCYDTGDGDWVDIRRVATYKVGEVVAVAQSYKDMSLSPGMFNELAGWNNKMFADTYWIKRYGHQIRITDIKVERLQDISDEDCLKEGLDWIIGSPGILKKYTFFGTEKTWNTRREAFAALIDKISGKGTWNRNPYAFAYTFKLED